MKPIELKYGTEIVISRNALNEIWQEIRKSKVQKIRSLWRFIWNITDTIRLAQLGQSIVSEYQLPYKYPKDYIEKNDK
jgi:hypothetical protein